MQLDHQPQCALEELSVEIVHPEFCSSIDGGVGVHHVGCYSSHCDAPAQKW